MKLNTDFAPVPIRGPKQLPLLGPTGNILKFFADPVGEMLRLHRRYGNLVALIDRNPAMVCAFGREHTQRVLSDASLFQNNEQLLFPVPPGGAAERLIISLPMMNGQAHRRQRQLMMPAFHRTAIEGYRDDMAAITARYLERWPTGRPTDVGAEIHELTLEIALKCLFGLENTPEVDNLGRLGTQYLEGLVSVGSLLFPYDLPGTPYRRFLRLADRLQQRVLRLIEDKRAQPEGQRDAFSALLRAHDEDGSTLTDAELVGQANILFISGHETTSYTLTWTLFLLAQHPRILADLVDELTARLHGEAPTVQQLAELPLLDHVLKESMRLLPAVPLLFLRFGAAAFQLGGVDLPRGTGIVLSPFIAHRQPDLFLEPERFDPARWARIQPTAYEFMPFGAGPRMCIGAGFATLATRVVLAMIVQRFRFSITPHARVSRMVRGVTLGPKYGIPMTLARQDRDFRPPAPVRGDIHELVRLEG